LRFPGNGGDLTRAVFVARPELWASLSGAANPNLNVRSGEYYGIPSLGSKHASANTIYLIDPGRISLALGAVRVGAFREGDIELQDSTTIDGDSPAPTTVMTSLFQRNLVALLVEIDCNWRAEAGACAIYSADSPV